MLSPSCDGGALEPELREDGEIDVCRACNGAWFVLEAIANARV